MNLSALKKMMWAIEQNQPIHLIRFKELVSKLNIQHRVEAADIRGIKIKGDRYRICYIHPTIKQEIDKLIADMGHDRISAARQNLSHQHKVQGSFILIRQIPNHPQVVIFDHDGQYQTPISLSRIAVILENRQIFLNIEKMYAFLQHYTDVPCSQPIDFIFGTGNEIPNSLHQHFLNQYDHLYLCFDCDLGGLKIAKNIKTLLPLKPMTFVQPHDIEQRLSNVVQTCTPDELDKLAQFSLHAPAFLNPFIEMIRNSKCRLEQESFLNDQ
ncbi:hypothetical protein G9F32_13495 [Acinetobacter sp. 194]|uniref:hypothetical protein n=1 Tax=Acinetobacter shaoyimingii TaxID=2715164 RepID=UPI00140CD88F|nr:hypothetical protein [Acinetobacter shaoyimingii]NHB59025.1 hypothetical protein [Acinetobacter shaoyimingii]